MSREERLRFVAVFVVSLAFLVGGAVSRAHAFTPSNDALIQADVRKALENKKFKGVSSVVQNGTVRLTGTVELYADKKDLERRVNNLKDVGEVDDRVKVGGPTVENAALRSKLTAALANDRPGDPLDIEVFNGVVTLSGTMYGPGDAESALGLVANTPGVKDIVNRTDVGPIPVEDEALRATLVREIYGTPPLQKYTSDPTKPIRLTVVDGKVTLAGVMDSEADKHIAEVRANDVPGVFKLTNDIQVISPSGK